MKYDSPLKLRCERVWRTYLGGALLDEFHGISPACDTHFPEDWIMSVVRAVNAGREDVVEGLNWAADEDCTLKDYIAADPAAALGAEHVARWGATPAVLLKVIDAAERLGVQVHPDKPQALKFFNSPFGKTECWHILGGRTLDGEAPCVYMGFKQGVTRTAWRDVFDRQDIAAMLDMLHRFEVHPGDTFLVNGGVPHAIGKGCLLMEIQEPSDYTLRTEKVTPQGFAISERQCHYGIGFDAMFDCFDYTGTSAEEGLRRWRIPAVIREKTPDFTRRTLVSAAETPCFALERFDVAGTCPFTSAGRFFGLYVAAGTGVLRSAAGDVPLTRGDQFFVPAASAPFALAASAPLVVFRAFGPDKC